ncbi:MAG: ACT domain-containing protein [Deltaproteobacteria bacterium]|nr:ACT domain-containing protein [Deltaproteobacteria bacterium]
MKQITIVAENRVGLLAEITAALAARNVNIETLDAEGINDHGILILTVDKYDEALQVINTIPRIRAISEDAILIRLSDKPGALAEIAKRFKDSNINLRSIRILRRDADHSLVAISAERTKDALELVKDVLIS